MGGEALLGEWLPLQSAAMSLLLALVVIALMLSITEKKKHPPAVPISAIMRDLMMFKEERPHRIFTAWAKKYGPIYSVRTGAGAVVVLNSSQTAKQAMVDNHSSISTKRLTKALQTLSLDQTMVALSDYGEEHKLLKKMMITHLLGTTPQRNNRFLREEMVQRIVDSMHSEIRANSKANVGLLNISKHIMNQLFPFALKQLIGRDVESVYVEEMGSWVCLQQIYDIVVGDVAKGALEINWRDFVPYIGPWLPNRPLQNKLRQLTKRRAAVVRALIEEERKLLSSGKEPNCYLDMLLKEGKKLQGKQLETAIWEPLVESIITSHVTMVWAMFELGRNPECQKRLRQEIKQACGDGVVREDDVHKLPYLKAIIRETLRKYPPLPLLPLRYVHKDVELDGYHVPAGWKILLNIHGIGKDQKQWEKAETWNPDRHLTARAEEESMDLQGTSMTFGAGKRLCAGWMQAMSIICLTISRIAHDFEWQVALEGEDKVETVKNTGTHRLHPLIALVTPHISHPSNS